MTFVGHTLFGTSLAVLAVPSGWPRRRQMLLAAGFVALANLPDVPLPFWGHARYDVSHSVFVAVGLLGAVSVALLAAWHRARALPRIWIGAWAAWLSHLLLDTFYNHGQGLAVFWPFGHGRVALPLPWFETLRAPFPHLDPHAAHVFAVELAAYGLVLAAAAAVRWAPWPGRAAGKPCRPETVART